MNDPYSILCWITYGWASLKGSFFLFFIQVDLCRDRPETLHPISDKLGKSGNFHVEQERACLSSDNDNQPLGWVSQYLPGTKIDWFRLIIFPPRDDCIIPHNSIREASGNNIGWPFKIDLSRKNLLEGYPQGSLMRPQTCTWMIYGMLPEPSKTSKPFKTQVIHSNPIYETRGSIR